MPLLSTLKTKRVRSSETLFIPARSNVVTNQKTNFESITTVRTVMAVFWDAATCILVDIGRCFRRVCLHHDGDDGGSKYV
jgi:hypothetical protein